MDAVNELDNLLKHAMQFDSGEVPEPDSAIQKGLRKKLKGQTPAKNRYIASLASQLGLDIKLYYLGLAVSAATIFIVFRNTSNEPKHTLNNIIIADTNSGSDTNFGVNPRYDTFQTERSALRIY